MPDLLFSWPVTVVITVVILALVGVSLLLVSSVVRTASVRLHCPRVGRRVVVQFLTDGRDPVSVLSCSAFEDPRHVACGAPCLTGGGRHGMQARHDQDTADLLSG
jgi:hypothetical protein